MSSHAKKVNLGLLPKLLIGIALGIAVGFIAPEVLRTGHLSGDYFPNRRQYP